MTSYILLMTMVIPSLLGLVKQMNDTNIQLGSAKVSEPLNCLF